MSECRLSQFVGGYLCRLGNKFTTAGAGRVGVKNPVRLCAKPLRATSVVRNIFSFFLSFSVEVEHYHRGRELVDGVEICLIFSAFRA